MNINDYWQSIIQNAIGCTIGSFFAIVISILIYWLTNLNSQNEKRELEQRQERESLQYFTELIRNVLQSAKHQSGNIQKFCIEIKADPLNVPLLHFISLFDFKRIAELHALDKSFFAYTNKYKEDKNVVKDFRRVIATVEFLYTQFQELPLLAKNGKTFDHERKVQFQQIFADSFSLLGQYMAHIDYDNPDKVAKRFMNIMDNYSNKNTSRTDIKFAYENFFVPINNVVVDLLSTGVRLPLFMQLGELTRDGKQLFQSISEHNIDLATDMGLVYQDTENGINNLEIAASKLFLD